MPHPAIASAQQSGDRFRPCGGGAIRVDPLHGLLALLDGKTQSFKISELPRYDLCLARDVPSDELHA
jgi:hypothetical protein